MPMKLSTFRGIIRRIRGLLVRDPSRFLRSVSGVIHVGANTGQEAEYYASLGLKVLWVEPIPSVFQQLERNIAAFPRQQAIQGLITDKDNEHYEFYIANNNGASSSILELKDHKDIWPKVKYESSISIKSKTLPSLLRDQNIDASSFDTLVMDTQGSELLVLKGAESILKHFRFVKTEVADFESYSGCCRLEEIDQFMEMRKFRQISRRAFAYRAQGGAYYDVTYKRKV